MPLTRREFVAGVGGAGLLYLVGCGRPPGKELSEEYRIVPRPNFPGIDFREWIFVSDEGTVTVCTSRCEIGQGLTTALTDLICDGMELPRERVEVVLGDTELCPSDGPTTGSAATRYVAWELFLACAYVKADLVDLAAERLGCSAEELTYREGEIVGLEDATKRIGIGGLAEEGRVRVVETDDPNGRGRRLDRVAKPYVDRGRLNVNGEAIVTGTLKYTGDLQPEGVRYGAMLVPPYHWHLTDPAEYDLEAARKVPGVSLVKKRMSTASVVARTFHSAQKALSAVEMTWTTPERPEALDSVAEIRSGRKLVEIMEESGRVRKGLEESDLVVEETYVTQYGSQVPMETQTAIADVGEDRAVVHLGTQNPFYVRHEIARKLKLPVERVHVVSLPAGGAFGAKAGHRVGPQAAILSKQAGAPVKLVYTRLQQFKGRGRFKESVVFDVKSGVTSGGRWLAREIDIHQDEGHGTVDVYAVPNVETRLYQAPMPTRHATMRGTSYTQDVWALESHADSLAHAVGMDPIEFRWRNVHHLAFRPLLERCAEKLGHPRSDLAPDHGVGFAIVNHGGAQLGVVGAEVAVDRATGKIDLRRLCGVFDIGLVINRHTTRMGVKGAMIWGVGWALTEEVRVDGHRAYVESLADYHIPRFSDVPPIEIEFLDTYSPGSPRGCGEMPLCAVPPAICNAVYDATGVRIRSLPLTPERVKAALEA